jgi:DNA-binding transcriptional ArsR family regulator
MSNRPPAQPDQPRLIWDIGTAYDFFASLDVLHNPDEYGLRASWAAGVRSRLPVAERKLLEDVQSFIWVPLHWIYNLPAPKDVASALWSLRQTLPPERLMALNSSSEMEDFTAVYRSVAERRAWDKGDVEAIRELLNREKKDQKHAAQFLKALPKYLDWWTRPAEFGELYLSALQSFYQVFFAEEEKRIAPYLQEALDRAQELAAQLEFSDLLADLSQGVHFGGDFDTPELVLAPAFWSTPLVLWGKVSPDSTLLLYGARPADATLIPGEAIPEVVLRALKALADPTRLQILRYLNEEQLTPAELSRRLRLRAPTVIHHLSALRLAGLVHLIMDNDGEKRYAARLGAVPGIFSSLGKYLQIVEKIEQ